MVKIYQTLDEALQEIDFAGMSLGFGHGKFKDKKHEEYTFIRWLSMSAELLGISMEKSPEQNEKECPFYKHKTEACYVFLELVRNAYRLGVDGQEGRRFHAGVYSGSRGIVVGTEQEANFLTREHIELLKQGRPVPSTNTENPGGLGTQIITNVADGLFISEEKRAIYVLRLFSSPARESIL